MQELSGCRVFFQHVEEQNVPEHTTAPVSQWTDANHHSTPGHL